MSAHGFLTVTHAIKRGLVIFSGYVEYEMVKLETVRVKHMLPLLFFQCFQSPLTTMIFYVLEIFGWDTFPKN